MEINGIEIVQTEPSQQVGDINARVDVVEHKVDSLLAKVDQVLIILDNNKGKNKLFLFPIPMLSQEMLRQPGSNKKD